MSESKDKPPSKSSSPFDALPPLPKGWCWTRVDAVGEVKLGRQRSPEHHHGKNMRPYLRVANVYEDRIDLSDVLEMNFTPKEFETFQLRFGDILLNEGQSLEWVGRPAMFRDELPGACFQNTLVRFRAYDCVLSNYALGVFRYYLHNQRFQKIAKWTTNIAHLGAGRLAEVEFPLPPLNEQRRIVAKIEELFSDLDAGVAALKRAKANLKRYRAAVLKAAVEGKLTAEWRAKHLKTEPASKLLERILIERRKKWEAEQLAKFAEADKEPPKNWKSRYVEPIPPDTTDLPELPEGWAVASVDQLTTTITSGSRDWTQYYGSGTGTFIMAQNVRKGLLDLDYRQAVNPPPNDRDSVRSQVAYNDLLVTIVGANTGDVCRVPSELPEHYVCQSVALMRPVLADVAKYVEAYFVADHGGQKQFRRYIYGQGRPHLGFDELRMTPVVLPPLPEQKQVIEEIEERLSSISAIQQQVEAHLRRSARLRQSILKRAFQGNLVPQEPNDEPANVLLERIKAESTIGNGKPVAPKQKRAKQKAS